MSHNDTSATYKAIASRAKEFIEKRWRDDLTLEQIATHVFMSPYHFQRIFKRETGETPKEYQVRLRIEHAVHTLRAFPNKPVYDVAVDSGFSSQSVFARAFHQKYGLSPTRFRKLSLSEVARIPRWDDNIRQYLLSDLYRKYTASKRVRFLDSIKVRYVEPIHVIYTPITMNSETHISREFQSFTKNAAAYDLATKDSQYYGLIYDFALHTPLEKCRYKVCLSIPPDRAVDQKFFTTTIPGGKYAVFPVRGNIDTMIQLAILFFTDWLVQSNYQMAELFWFERFSVLPTTKNYSTKTREIFAPIKPR